MKNQLKIWAVAITASASVFACTDEGVIEQQASSNSPSSERVSATCAAQGWASKNSGTNGGGTAAETTVSNYTTFKAAVQNTAVKVIKVTGTITFPAGGRITFQSQTGKTIYGAAGAKLVSTDQTKDGSGIIYMKSCSNILFRNLIFDGAGAFDTDGNDNLTVDACTNVWVDHCDFRDGVDGNFDIKTGSDFITVSWTKFSYAKPPTAGGSGGTADHRFSNLIGSSDDATSTDQGKLNVTFASCWWGPGCRERMPRVRFGKVHIINSYFNSNLNGVNASKCIMAGKEANILSENNVFENANNPIYLVGTTHTALQVKNCTFTNVTGNQNGSGTAFNPASQYTAITGRAAANVKSSVTGTNGAGATISGNVCTYSAL